VCSLWCGVPRAFAGPLAVCTYRVHGCLVVILFRSLLAPAAEHTAGFLTLPGLCVLSMRAPVCSPYTRFFSQ
jgi:hypothetical protein